MKKIFISIISIAAVCVACNPVEVRDNIGGSITAEELKAMSKVTVWQENGKNINYVTCETSAPVSALWSSVTQFQGSYGELQLFAPGEQTVLLKGLCADGTVVETEFKVNVEVMAKPVADQWGYLTNGSQKAWTWANISNVWGNGGYKAGTAEEIANGSGEWWGVSAADIKGQCENYGFDPADAGNATMTFGLQGTTITKSSGATGKYSFDMSKTADHYIGTFTATGAGVLFPCVINKGTQPTTYEITRLDADHLDLIYAADGTGGWSECTHWHFVPAN